MKQNVFDQLESINCSIETKQKSLNLQCKLVTKL